jgi:hypothetical protein
MLAKSLSFLGGAVSAGIVLGARVPIIPTSYARGTAGVLCGRVNGGGSTAPITGG